MAYNLLLLVVVSITFFCKLSEADETSCGGDLLPGVSKLAYSIDVTQLDLMPKNHYGLDGFKIPIIDFTCEDGKKFTNNDNGVTYSVPDQIRQVFMSPRGEFNPQVNVYKTTSDVQKSLAVEVGLNVDFSLFGSFSTSTTYKRSENMFKSKDVFMSSADAFVGGFRVDVNWTNTFNQDILHYIDNTLPSSYADDPEKYQQFVNIYGTHYFSAGIFGGRLRHEITTSKDLGKTMSDQEISVNVEASYMSFLKAKGAKKGRGAKKNGRGANKNGRGTNKNGKNGRVNKNANGANENTNGANRNANGANKNTNGANRNANGANKNTNGANKNATKMQNRKKRHSLNVSVDKNDKQVDADFSSVSETKTYYYGGKANLLEGEDSWKMWWDTVAANPWLCGGNLVTIDNVLQNGNPKRDGIKLAVKSYLMFKGLPVYSSRLDSFIRNNKCGIDEAHSYQSQLTQLMAQTTPVDPIVTETLLAAIDAYIKPPKLWTENTKLCYGCNSDYCSPRSTTCSGINGRYTASFQNMSLFSSAGLFSTPPLQWLNETQICFYFADRYYNRQFCTNVDTYTPQDGSVRLSKNSELFHRYNSIIVYFKFDEHQVSGWFLNTRLCKTNFRDLKTNCTPLCYLPDKADTDDKNSGNLLLHFVQNLKIYMETDSY